MGITSILLGTDSITITLGAVSSTTRHGRPLVANAIEGRFRPSPGLHTAGGTTTAAG
ncbi:hypothetical protein [Streptomyces sp. SID12501]|uniref:Uncharacterized protein n=1 Tax=Streptomyces sp. SID12501 TaxID=2706042 RepID=A0A6B3BHU3_9ACTN|nr:hypothetical protein [Streptomyces sp. SID12501]NEC85261.1 hypothetical protein [Streptomyces sp. SID12501]